MTEPLRRFALALYLGSLLLLPSTPALAQEHPQPPQTNSAEQAGGQQAKTGSAGGQTVADRLPPTSVTNHTLTLAGEALRYSATAGTIALRDAQGKTTADIFYVAYAREPRDAKRPVTFVFNGGPGAASAYLHLGAIGPKIVAASDNGELVGPPPRLIDNDSTWLTFTDLVFVDPVGTGYSRVADGKSEHDFWGVEQDTEALAGFIRVYLIDAARMAAPIFLTGESYGGFRAVTITRELQKNGGGSPSGLVLVSPALEFALLSGEDYDPLPWALALPSYAAVKLESEGVTGRAALKVALKDAEHYALSNYLVALASGAEPGGKTAAAEVARLTGLPLDVVNENLARISPSVFIKEFGRANRQLLSRYDGSVKAPDPQPSSTWPRGPDPVLDATVPLWTSAFVEYAQTELDYKTDENYRLLNRSVRGKWDFGTTPNRQGYAGVLDDIQKARAANRQLAVIMATGYTDLITPYLAPTYLVSQLPPLEGAVPITIEDYAGGHMLYLRPESRRALKDDVEAMYRRALDPSQSEG
ncbi:MAG: S10 family peptidase [Methyloceanibacter sp.]